MPASWKPIDLLCGITSATSPFAATRHADRPATSLPFRHRDREFVAAQIFSLRKQMNNRLIVTPRIGVLGESQPGWRPTSAFGDVTFRYRLYSNWLFAELIPAVEFPREESFKDRASLIFRVEMFFSGVIEDDRF